MNMGRTNINHFEIQNKNSIKKKASGIQYQWNDHRFLQQLELLPIPVHSILIIEVHI